MLVKVPIPLTLCDLKHEAENEATGCEVALQELVYRMLMDSLRGHERSSMEGTREEVEYVREALDACQSYDVTLQEGEDGRWGLTADWSRYAKNVRRFEA